jgi:hypothetical protein
MYVMQLICTVKCYERHASEVIYRSNQRGTSLVTALLKHMSEVTDTDSFGHYVITRGNGHMTET